MDLKWKILLPVIAVCTFVGMGVGVNFLLGYALRTTTATLDELDSSQIFSIMWEESVQRFEGTPFRAFALLAEPAENGSITFDFSQRDAMTGEAETSGRLTFHSDVRNESFALLGDMSSPFIGDIDMSIFVSSERIALGTNIFDDNLYGIRFSTFEEDFHAFAPVIGLDPFMVDEFLFSLQELAVALSELEDYDTYIDWDEIDWDNLDEMDWGELEYLIPHLTPFGELLNDFAESFDEQRTSVTIGGQNAIRYTYSVSSGSVMDFMDDFVNVFARLDVGRLTRESIDVFGEQIETQMQGMELTDMMINEVVQELSSFQRDMVREMRDGIRTLRNESDEAAIIYQHIYMSTEGRLLRYAIEESGSEISLDFGTSVYDPWVFHMDFIYEDEQETLIIEWAFTSDDNLIVNRLSVEDSRNGGSHNAIGSEWAPNTGNFTLWVEEEGQRIGSIDGIFRVQSNGAFELRFSEIVFIDVYIDFGLSTTIGANIPNANFINMDQWDENLVARIEELLMPLMTMDLGALGLPGL